MKKFNYILSCSGKFHYFEVAKILHERNQLTKIVCGYPWIKLKNEKIPKNLVGSHGIFNILNYLYNKIGLDFDFFTDYLNKLNYINIDKITSNHIDNYNEVDVLIGLAKVGLNSGKKMVRKNKIYICERASAHITFQNNILIEEYNEFNKKKFKINNWFVDRELKEYEESDIILVPSNFAKKTFDSSISNKVKVLEYGANTQNFFVNKDIKKSLKYFDILFIGNLSLQKGLHYLIEAFHNFKHPNKRLHIVGALTTDEDFFKDKFQHENIIVYGHIPQLKLNDIINKCHVYVLPSIQDGFALTALQSISAGCPAIVSENTGIAELIKNNKCGFVVPIRNSNAIVDKLQLFADDKDLLNECSLNGVNFAINNTWSDYVTKLDSLIFKFKQNL